MCGIVGYIGDQDAKDILLRGLEKLEYRGYDSAGIALVSDKGVQVWKENGRFAVVNNGVIDNYQELKQRYLQHATFKSDTDTEVIVQLVENFVDFALPVEEAFRRTLLLLKGSFAVVMVDRLAPETIYVGKNKSPLLLGIGRDFHVIASDAMAALQLTSRFVELMDGEMAIVRRHSKTIKTLSGSVVERKPFTVSLDASEIEKGPYPHYMLKEIDEQPSVIRNVIAKYQESSGEIAIDINIREAMKDSDRIFLIGCGTSYHAGLVGKQLLEIMAGVPVEVHVAGEFLYNRPILSGKPLFIFISQSGETADSRGVLTEIRKLGYRTLTITNAAGSTLSREADYTLLTHAGPEIAVASTKAYTAQLAVLILLAYDCAKAKGMNIRSDPAGELSPIANAMEIIAPLVSVIPLQLFAYYAALFRGCDVDKPRNLAKSVTVE